MADIASCYRALDLEPGASSEEIKQAWRDLAQVWHPDRFADNPRLQDKAQETLKQINAAYAALQRAGAPAAAPKRPNAYEPEIFETGRPELSPTEVLAEGVQKWNLWRKKYSNIVPRLPRARLEGRALEGVDFREMDLTAADLRGADLYKANLSEALLVRARLNGADLSRALLLGAVFMRADLSQADLSSADLRGSNLREATLAGATLIGARLEGADLTGAIGLEPRQIELAVIDAQTKLPVFERG